jgi:GNAT superfamily N-acetyltransferase
MERRDLPALATIMAGQLRRWHAADPRLACPADTERAARRALDDDRDLRESWAVVAERAQPGAAPVLVGYLRCWWRHFGDHDAQLMWLPQNHLTSEALFQFAGAAEEDPSALIQALLPAAHALSPAPPGEPWTVSLVPPGAGLDTGLTALGFRCTSVFAFRAPEPPAPAPVPPGWTIRAAGNADLPAIVDLYAELCAYHQRNDPYSDREPPNLRENFGYVLQNVLDSRQRWVLLVAHPAATPTPRAFVLASVDWEEASRATITQMPPGRSGFIHDFMVDEAARGQGLGRALWAATVYALHERAPGPPSRHGLQGTWVIYRPSNPTGGRFWPAQGYTPLYTMWRRGGWTAT